MKNKRVAAVAVALALVAVFSVSAFALPLFSIGDILQIISMTDSSIYTKFSEQEWGTMTPAERAEQINFVINDQKGTSYITESSDFVNDADKSFKYYCSLVDTSSSQGMANNLGCKSWFELNGLADFGLGYYTSVGDGSVADTLNDNFIDYIQKYPYVGQDTPSTAYKFSNGYYVDWDPLLIGNAPVAFAVDGVKHSGKHYGLRFYLHDETGKIIDMVDHKGFNSYRAIN